MRPVCLAWRRFRQRLAGIVAWPPAALALWRARRAESLAARRNRIERLAHRPRDGPA